METGCANIGSLFLKMVGILATRLQECHVKVLFDFSMSLFNRDVYTLCI